MGTHYKCCTVLTDTLPIMTNIVYMCFSRRKALIMNTVFINEELPLNLQVTLGFFFFFNFSLSTIYDMHT